MKLILHKDFTQSSQDKQKQKELYTAKYDKESKEKELVNRQTALKEAQEAVKQAEDDLAKAQEHAVYVHVKFKLLQMKELQVQYAMLK